jgi:hypothetical protein
MLNNLFFIVTVFDILVIQSICVQKIFVFLPAGSVAGSLFRLPASALATAGVFVIEYFFIFTLCATCSP